jgi:hypothetical protein
MRRLGQPPFTTVPYSVFAIPPAGTLLIRHAPRGEPAREPRALWHQIGRLAEHVRRNSGKDAGDVCPQENTSAATSIGPIGSLVVSVARICD